MPTFGVCAAVEKAGEVKAAGWEYVEENVQGLLQGQLPEAEWKGMARVAGAALPVVAANCLVPGGLKICGPEADLGKLEAYMKNVCRRAGQAGIKTLVFGSGGARAVPEGFDRAKARQQILAFVRMAAPLAQAAGVTIVAEHLNKKECNIINSVAEAMTYVREVNHPAFQCLVDSWHFWLENESLESLREAMPWIRHVHLADKDGRVAPGQAGTSDYRPFFAVLKKAGYEGPISVEAKFVPDFSTAAGVLAYVKKAWKEA